jgi:dsRNA-specific ribonuclease
MSKTELFKLFKLENHAELFTVATRPPSCGGGDAFRSLAIEGDKLLDNAIIRMFQRMGMQNSGEITQKKQQFHNARTLGMLGTDYLELSNHLKPTDGNYQIQNSDVKETIEALIAACSRANGEKAGYEVVELLFSVAVDKALLELDYISKLNLLLQTEIGNPLLQWSEPIRIGGMDHAPILQVKLNAQFRGRSYDVTSDPFSNSKIAKRDAAKKMLQQITQIPIPEMKIPIIPHVREVPMRATQSLSQREITFTKSDVIETESGTMNISVGTGQLLVDWVAEKMKKDAYGALILLSAILPDEIRGSAWDANINNIELCMLHLQIQQTDFFEIGCGPSKTQARKNAANKIIKSSHLYEWLTEKHPHTLK